MKLLSSEPLLKNNSNPEIAVQEIPGRRYEILGRKTACKLGRPFNDKIMCERNRS
jgi:hypothetical protein